MLKIIEDPAEIEQLTGTNSHLVDYIVHLAGLTIRVYGLFMTETARGSGTHFYWVEIPVAPDDHVEVTVKAGGARENQLGALELPFDAAVFFDPVAVRQALEQKIVPELESHGGQVRRLES